MQNDLPNYLNVLALIPAANVTADGNGASFDVSPYDGKITIRADIGPNATGTSPTLDLTVKQSSDNSNWSNANVSTAFTQATGAATAQTISFDTRDNARYMRVDRDIGGTNAPSFPLSVIGIAHKRYNAA